MNLNDFTVPQSWGTMPAFTLFTSKIQPEKVLYEENGHPLLYTHLTKTGQLALCYAASEGFAHDWVVVVPTTEMTVKALEENTLPVRDALNQPWIWLMVQNAVTGWGFGRIPPNLEAIPEDNLPRPGTLLFPTRLEEIKA